MNEVALFMRYGYESNPASPSSWSGQTLRNIQDSVKRANNRYMYPPGYVWSWMRGIGSLQTANGNPSYVMDEDFGGLRTPMFYDDSVGHARVLEISMGMLLKLRSRDESTGYPTRVAFTTQNLQGKAVTRKVAELWRPPSGAWNFTFEYNRRTVDLDSTHPYPMGGPETAELLRLLCLADAELRLKNIPNGPQERQAQMALQEAIANDKLNGPKHFGTWHTSMRANEADMVDRVIESSSWVVSVET